MPPPPPRPLLLPSPPTHPLCASPSHRPSPSASPCARLAARQPLSELRANGTQGRLRDGWGGRCVAPPSLGLHSSPPRRDKTSRPPVVPFRFRLPSLWHLESTLPSRHLYRKREGKREREREKRKRKTRGDRTPHPLPSAPSQRRLRPPPLQLQRSRIFRRLM